MKRRRSAIVPAIVFSVAVAGSVAVVPQIVACNDGSDPKEMLTVAQVGFDLSRDQREIGVGFDVANLGFDMGSDPAVTDLGGAGLDVSGPARSRKRTIRHTLTETPLARQHAHFVAGRDRRPKAVDWSSFDRSRYPKPALALAFDAHRSLATGEYGAITLFARLASALALNGAPLDIVTAAARVPADEARHADLALRMAALCAGCAPHDVAIDIEEAALEAQWHGVVSLDRLDGAMTEVAAISETLAAALLTGCRRRAKTVLRTLFTTIVSDEIHHARLGWFYLTWRAPQWTRAERQRVADRAGAVIVDVERRFSRGRDAKKGSQAAARALGVLDSAAQQQIVRQVMEDEIVPALDALGLGASHAWRKRSRAK